MSTFLNRLREHFTDVLHIFRNELVKVVKDEGVLMFLVVVPLGYPLLYSWIYNNESLHETPVVVVDQSHSALSRQFINDCDASPDVHIKYYAEDLDEARSLVSRQLVKGIYLIPSDFSERVNRGEQATVSVYCDMSLMLAYKAVYQTAVVEAGRLGAGMNIKRAGNYTKREDAITAQPLAVDDVAMFNPSGGYGSCVLPAVLMLILQQAIALGIGMAAGTARERHRNGQLIPADDQQENDYRDHRCGAVGTQHQNRRQDPLPERKPSLNAPEPGSAVDDHVPVCIRHARVLSARQKKGQQIAYQHQQENDDNCRRKAFGADVQTVFLSVL